METFSNDVRISRPLPALKPSLVEWKHRVLRYGRQGFRSLETFLGGMETSETVEISVFVPKTLKPSLVEWKPGSAHRTGLRHHALKPSLVEWKHGIGPDGHVGSDNLETFLSGIETT